MIIQQVMQKEVIEHLMIDAANELDEDIAIQQGLPTYFEIVKENKGNLQLANKHLKNCSFEFDQRNTGLDSSDESQPDNEDQFDMKSDRSDDYLENIQIIRDYEIQFLPKAAQNDKPIIVENQKIAKAKRTNAISKKRKSKKYGKNRRSKRLDLSQTKNIPKNYGKQIIKFIKKQKKLTQRALKFAESRFTYDKLMQELKVKKKALNKISELRKLWMDYDYSKQFRILTQVFLRKYSLNWIFNSRIEKVKYPIKYRFKIAEGVRNPADFEHLKDY